MNERTGEETREGQDEPQLPEQPSANIKAATVNTGLVPESASTQLDESLKDLKYRQQRVSIRRRRLVALGLLLLATALVSALFSERIYKGLFSWAFILYGLMFITTAYGLDQGSIEANIRDLEYQKQLLGIPADSAERRAEILFRQERDNLNRYYAQTLLQGRWIFMTGLACIVLGFLIIGITLYYVINSRAELNDKILTAVLGAAGSILTNFISVVFLRMYGETVKNLAEFHSRLLGTHYLHFANVMTWKLGDDGHRVAALRLIIDTACRGALPMSGGQQIASDQPSGIGAKSTHTEDP